MRNAFKGKYCEPAHLEYVFSGGFIICGLKSFVLWNGSFSFFPRHIWFGITFNLDPKNCCFPWKRCVFKVTKSMHKFYPCSNDRPPSSTVTGASLHLKSGVLLPSGMLVAYCVMVTPGSLDLFFTMAETIGEICFNYFQPKMDKKYKYSGYFWWGGFFGVFFATSRGQDCHTFPVKCIKQRTTTGFNCDIYFWIGKFRVHLNEWMMNDELG